MQKLSLTELNRPDADQARRQQKMPVALVLDNVRSALNVGSAFRTADAFALAHLYLGGITAQPPHREILKTALGATETVPWTYAPQPTDLVRQLRQQGYAVWAVEQAVGSTPLQQFVAPPAPTPLALVFGNEVSGVSQEVMDLVDGAIEIPQLGAKHSLNISVCVGVVAWELFRKWVDLPDTLV